MADNRQARANDAALHVQRHARGFAARQFSTSGACWAGRLCIVERRPRCQERHCAGGLAVAAAAARLGGG
eukprot:2013119-Prymnesium_polylepis.1